MRGEAVLLQCDSATAVATLQHGKGRDNTLQAIAREIWLVAATHDLDLRVVHIAGELLTPSADALSRWHLGAPFQQRARDYMHNNHIQLVDIPEEAFFVDSDL
jgi:hypothetical protein